MQINKLIQSTESQPIKPGKNLSNMQPTTQGSHSEITHEQEHHGAQHTGKDKLDASTPASRTKPTVLDFIEQEADCIKPSQSQTKMIGENGDPFPSKPPMAQTLAMGENGDNFPSKPPIAQTLAMGENGDDFSGKPPMAQTLAMGENGDNFPSKPPRGQTKMIGENGEPGVKPPHIHTHAMGENGDHFPSKPPQGQTKMIGENGEHGHFKSQLNKLDDSQ